MRILLILLISGILYAQKTEIVQTYNEFKDITQYSIRFIEIQDSVLLNINSYFSGNNLDTLIKIHLHYIFMNDKKKYSKKSILYYIVDKERFFSGCDHYRINIDKDIYWEHLTYCIDLIILKKLIDANKIKFKIINDIFEMDKSDLNWIKKYIEKLK